MMRTRELGPLKECVVCLSAPRETRFDCGHACCCAACSAVLLAQPNASCPNCRAPIQGCRGGPDAIGVELARQPTFVRAAPPAPPASPTPWWRFDLGRGLNRGPDLTAAAAAAAAAAAVAAPTATATAAATAAAAAAAATAAAAVSSGASPSAAIGGGGGGGGAVGGGGRARRPWRADFGADLGAWRAQTLARLGCSAEQWRLWRVWHWVLLVRP